MKAALIELSAVVAKADGSEGVEFLRYLGNEQRLIFLEKCVSEERHAKGLALLPPGVLDGVQAAAGGPPDGA
jgi:hypothetical protein